MISAKASSHPVFKLPFLRAAMSKQKAHNYSSFIELSGDEQDALLT